jgi:hypothetical protein
MRLRALVASGCPSFHSLDFEENLLSFKEDIDEEIS